MLLLLPSYRISNYVVLAALRLMVLLPESPLCWDYGFNPNKHLPDFTIGSGYSVRSAYIYYVVEYTCQL